MITGIYKVTNPIGEIYIGKSRDIKKRWATHKTPNAKLGPLLKESYDKFGTSNHSFEILYELPNDTDNDILFNYEEFYTLQYLNAGYKLLNIAIGKNNLMTQETRDKLKLLANFKNELTMSKIEEFFSELPNYDHKVIEEFIANKIGMSKRTISFHLTPEMKSILKAHNEKYLRSKRRNKR